MTLREAQLAVDRFVAERPATRLGDLVAVARWLGSIDVEADEPHQIVTVDIDLQEATRRLDVSLNRELWFDGEDGEMLSIEMAVPAPTRMRSGSWWFSAPPDGFARWCEDQRGSLAMLVDREQDMTVVGEAGDGEEAIVLATSTRPDVVLMDIRMPGIDGLAATERILADPAASDVRVLVVTTFELDDYVLRALRAGASGFILKGVEPAELLSAIAWSPRATRCWPRASRAACSTASPTCTRRRPSSPVASRS